MPLSDSVLSGLIVANLKKAYDIEAPHKIKELADAIAQAVVAHIASAGVITTIVTIPSTGAPGAPSAGTGTGSIK